MPVLNPGVATRSRSPTLVVENRLDPGAWRFRLTVVDDTGLESAPAELVVRVVEQRLPPTGPTGPIVRPTDPRVVEPIRPITPSRPPG
jgi:hypothetical protein